MGTSAAKAKAGAGEGAAEDAPLDLAALIQSGHAAWAADEDAQAIQLYEQVLEAADAAGDSPGRLDPTDHLQCHANLGSSYMALASKSNDLATRAPDLARRAALLASSLEHWQVAERAGPSSPLLSYFLMSVKRDLGLASAGLQLEEELAATMGAAAPSPSGPRVEPIERREASELTYAEFIEKHVRGGVPVVITGNPVPQWDLDFLEERCGDVEVPRKCHLPGNAGTDWAALGPAEKVPLREHLAGLREGKTLRAAGVASDGGAPMLFDHAIAELCPELLEDFLVPKYFAVDYLRTIPKEERQEIWPNPQAFPSLFAQPSGTRCGLHVDQAGTHFYQMLVSGRKRWHIFRPEDAPRLYPRGHGLLFEADSFSPDLARFPLLGTAHVMEAVLEPGDTIFVPQGSPHQVQNEEVSVAISANYVAGVGLGTTQAELQLLAQGGARPEYERTANALQKWAPAEDAPLPQDPGDLPWAEFDAAVWRLGPGISVTGAE